MATITLEIGRKGKKKERAVSFLVCQGKTKKRIPTEVTVTDADLTSNQKKIKNVEKARKVEELLRAYKDRLYSLSLDYVSVNGDIQTKNFTEYPLKALNWRVTFGDHFVNLKDFVKQIHQVISATA